MKNKTLEFISFLYIVFFLIFMLNSVIKTIYYTISLETYSTYIYISGGVGLLLYIISKIKNFRFNVYEIIVFIMIVLSCLSLINAFDINTAIFGKTNRYEGLLVWLSYYIFLLNAINIKNKKYLYIIALLISTHMMANIIYGLYQVGILSKPAWLNVNSTKDYATGFLGNLSFFGSLACIFYGLVLGLFVKVKMGWRKCLLGIALLFASLGIIMSHAMSAIVGVIVINLVCFIQTIVLIIKKRKNSYACLGSLFVGMLGFLLVFFIYTIDRPSIKDNIVGLFKETKSVVVDKKVEDSYGTSRIYIWRNTLENFYKVPITGVGIDNFRNFFDKPLVTEKNIIVVDKAHNDYLQKAVCEGIVAGVIFVVFLLMVFFKGMFSKLEPIHYGLLMAFTCYSVQAFFNISFINVAPIYFITIGLLIGAIKKEKNIEV